MKAEKRKALSMYLRDIRDPRRRQGRIYPLASILTMLTLAAVNGESTLRGMWKWVEQHWEQICDRLELEWAESPPQYGTLWNVMDRTGAFTVWGNAPFLFLRTRGKIST